MYTWKFRFISIPYDVMAWNGRCGTRFLVSEKWIHHSVRSFGNMMSRQLFADGYTARMRAARTDR